ncbi:transglutaminase domain-containing protein [Polaribacter aestuariivivens]|nr:transglutaminase domain-containing protein [Polaribacter aestuariivivens]
MMKYFLFLLLLTTTIVNSQNYTSVDNKVLKYPRFSKVEDLVSKIENDFISDEDKTRAAFFWLAKNIQYNLKEYYNPTHRTYSFSYSSEAEKLLKLQKAKDKVVATVFKTKKGVCEDFAQSFKKICDLLDIQAEVIRGYVRNNTNEIGKPRNSTNHAWNAVKLNERWVILDATWASGFLYNGTWKKTFNEYFYDIPKDKIFKTHFPEDSIWILRFGRMSLKEFYNQPIYSNTFLKHNATLIAPTTGTINVNSSKTIELKFENLDVNIPILYAFKGNKFGKKPLIKKEDNVVYLRLNQAKKNSELVLYFNNISAIQFKTK